MVWVSFGVVSLGDRRDTAGRPQGYRRETAGRPQVDCRETAGRPQGDERGGTDIMDGAF